MVRSLGLLENMNRLDGLKEKEKSRAGRATQGVGVGRLSAWLVWVGSGPAGHCPPLKEPAPSGRGLRVCCHWVSDSSPWEEGRSICDPSNLTLTKEGSCSQEAGGVSETGGQGAGHNLYKNTSKDTTQAD